MIPAPNPKGFRRGTHRAIAPSETVARLIPLLPRIGITRVSNVTGMDTLDIPVVTACRPGSRSLPVAHGKGLDLVAARASALMESVEGFSAERIDAPLKLASLREMSARHRLMDVAGLPRPLTSAFHDQTRMLWIEGVDLISGEPMWLPFEVVHMSYTVPLPPGSGSFLMSSRGLGSGNHPLEAVSHGLCELVEHDATTGWRRRGEEAGRGRRVDLSTVDDLACQELLARYDRAGVDVAVWDTTSDVGIPSFLCTIDQRELDPEEPIRPASGLGCHPAREIALARALTEAAQARLGQRLGQERGGADEIEGWRRGRERRRAEPPVHRFGDVPTFHGEHLEDDVAWELQRLVGAGIEQVVVVELTRPEIGIPVVRVVIPGLEPLDDVPGYVPGPRARRWAKEGRA
jgi:ribosomal protein S12 methylthiotransferase accessory factor